MTNIASFDGSITRIDDYTSRIEFVSYNAHIQNVITDAIDISRYFGANMQFEFNNVSISVCSDSDPEFIERDFWRAHLGCIESKIGPHPKPILTEKEEQHYTQLKKAQR